MHFMYLQHVVPSRAQSYFFIDSEHDPVTDRSCCDRYRKINNTEIFDKMR